MRYSAISGLAVFALAGVLSGCANQLPGSGPSVAQLNESPAVQAGSIRVLEVSPALARKMASERVDGFAPEFDAPVSPQHIGRGDQVEVVIWEAAPAMLLASLADAGVAARQLVLPAQTVGTDGAITVPFVGRLEVADKDTKTVEEEIVKSLMGRAHKPQALVRVTRQVAREVTVVGEVVAATRMPLSPKGERLLDAIAAASGVKAPVDKVSVQITRAGRTRALPLDMVIRDPEQNVRLKAGDVVTVYHQPMSFTAMGAVQKAGEVPIEATGISLAQALARVGGVLDGRADAGGVFIFRQAEVPTIYRLDLRDPSSILAMRDFPVRDKDILYVSNAPLADFQKFMQLVSSVVYPVVSLHNLGQ